MIQRQDYIHVIQFQLRIYFLLENNGLKQLSYIYHNCTEQPRT